MASPFEKIYFKSPYWFQNIMVSVYGISLRNKRYAQPHDQFLEELEKNPDGRSPQSLLNQWGQFRDLLSHAFNTVPFYRNLAISQNLGLNDFQGFQDLDKLPIIDKETIRKDPSQFISDQFKPNSLFVLHTSGTTGTALSIYTDKISRRKHYAFWTRLRKWYGVMPFEKRATMFGRIICSAEQNTPPFWRYDATGRNLLMSSYHLSPVNLHAYAKKLEAYQASEILGYASSIYLLAKFLIKNPNYQIRPKVVITTADKLFPHFRSTIESAFGCPVVDQYGCAEMATFASQEKSGEYLVHPEHGFLEILDPDNNPVKPGETGEAVCTGFINWSMPFIRYRLGDRIAIPNGPSQPDNRVPAFSEIEGRADDILYSPDGRPLGRFSPIWKVVEGIHETQVIQNSLDSLDINIVVDEGFRDDSQKEQMVIKEIRKRTGPDMAIRMHFLDSISKNPNGKFRAVISKVNT